MPPKPAKGQTKSTPTNKSANDKDTIKELQKKVTNLEKDKKTLEQTLKEKDKEIECLKVVEVICGKGDNVSTTPITNSRDLRSAPAANGTIGEGNIQDQSKEIKRVKKEDTSLGSQSSLSESKEENKKLKEECNKLKEEKRNSQKPELNGENKNLESKISQLTEENERKKQKLYEEETKNSDLKKQIAELQKTQSQEKERIEKPSAEDKKNSDLTQKIKDLENKLSQQEQESKDKLSRVKQEKSKLEREFEELQKTLSQKEKENKSKSNSPKPAASRDLKDAEAQVKQLKEKNEKLMEEKTKAVKEVDNLKNRLAEKDKENSQLKKTVNDFQTENEQLKKTNKSNSPKSAASRDLKDAEAQVKQLKEKNETLMEEKMKAVKEVDNLKNRLSQIAGSKLTDNNPGIADLSDPNRPLNLGEKFSELYDNQWTDAMEEMTCTVDEKQAIEILLRIVNDAYEFCVEKSDGYCDQIETGITKLFNTELSSLQKKLTKDYRKSMAVYLVSDLEEEFCKRSYKFDGESVKSYQKHCIRVCWFMAVQDPKVFIDVEDVSGKKFEDDKYKHYTKTGKVTDYLVWPVLYLHKGGPMLGKGVAQGK